MRRRILYILAIPALHVIWTGITESLDKSTKTTIINLED